MTPPAIPKAQTPTQWWAARRRALAACPRKFPKYRPGMPAARYAQQYFRANPASVSYVDPESFFGLHPTRAAAQYAPGPLVVEEIVA